MSFWINNGHFIIEGGKAIRCERCPCEYFLDFIRIVIENGNIGTPEIIESDLVLGVMSSFNLVINYLGTEYGVTLEITANGPSEICGTNQEELDFDFKFIISEDPEFEDPVLVSTVPFDNVNCVFPGQISRIPYEETLETHTAIIDACNCTCPDDEAFEAVFNLQTTGGTTEPPPPEEISIIEVQEPVDPVDPDTTDLKFKIFYCYTRCPEEEDET